MRPPGCRCLSEQRAPFARLLPALESHLPWPKIRQRPPSGAQEALGRPFQCQSQKFLTHARPSRPPGFGFSYLRVNEDKEVFALWAPATSHLQEHVPWLPRALPDTGTPKDTACLPTPSPAP